MASSSRSGCLLFAIPRALLGARAAGALPDGLALPELDTSEPDPADLPALIKARNAGRRCHKVILGQASDRGLQREVANELVGWVAEVYAMGPQLRRARRFVVEHTPDRVARERADLELELVGETPERIRELKRQMRELDDRAAKAGAVAAEVERLATRLKDASRELDALHARVEQSLDDGDLVHEVRAWHQAAVLARSTFSDAVGELG